MEFKFSHDDSLLREVESALSVSVDRMSVLEMVLCLEYMAESGSRCLDLLKQVSSRLATDLSQLSLNQLVALLANLKRLSYLQPFILAPLVNFVFEMVDVAKIVLNLNFQVAYHQPEFTNHEKCTYTGKYVPIDG